MNKTLSDKAVIVLALVAVVVIVFAVMRFKGPAQQEQTTGSETTMQQYQRTGKFYNPPPGINPAGR